MAIAVMVPASRCLNCALAASEELPKLLDRQSGIDDETAHREGVDWIVAGNGQDLEAERYSPMAVRMFSSASSSVEPCDQQPGSPGTETDTPSSDRTNTTLYRIVPPRLSR
jgi:hypothetical protein